MASNTDTTPFTMEVGPPCCTNPCPAPAPVVLQSNGRTPVKAPAKPASGISGSTILIIFLVLSLLILGGFLIACHHSTPVLQQFGLTEFGY